MDLSPLREPEEHDHQAVDGEQRVAVQFSYYAQTFSIRTVKILSTAICECLFSPFSDVG